MTSKNTGAYETMQNQAGGRITRTMTDGTWNHTTHYASEEEFNAELAQKNENARKWGQVEWYAR